MKTLFVVCSGKVNRHVGEEYDQILEVEDQPTTQTILDWANRVKDGIRALWHEQKKEGCPEPKVSVNLDAASPYNAMLLNLQIIMKAEEGVVIELPYYKPVTELGDVETAEMLRRLDGKQ